MMSQAQRTQLLVIALLLFIPLAFLQFRIDPLHKQYEPTSASGINHSVQALPFTFALGAFTGFREAIAGLLWVRCDEFFHNGDYDAISPMIRIITWLDPHQTDVYATGAWHLDYNFTDAQERSDRRYIPMALALIKEGIANNPDDPDLYSDISFVHYFRKIADYPDSAAWFQRGWDVLSTLNQTQAAATTPDPTDETTVAKGLMTVGHGRAHALEAMGDIPGAIAQWQRCLALHQQLVNRDTGNTQTADRMDMTIGEKQLYEITQRAKWRPRDIKAPLDMNFNPILVRIAPKEFVVKGTLDAIGSDGFSLETGETKWAPVDGCRVELRLEDEGYKMSPVSSYTLSTHLDPNVTVLQDAISVQKGQIGGQQGHKIDLSQDPTMYPFHAPRYTVTFWFPPNNPNDCPIQVQDRIGWHGEALTDKHYLVTTTSQTKMPGDEGPPIPGMKMLVKTLSLTREDILGKGVKVFN